MTPEQFYSNYSENGYIFSKSLLTRYCLSLYTKPFVILSGISGTGKTKIAQLFKATEPQIVQANQAVQNAQDQLGNVGFILLNITNGVLNGDGRGNFRHSDLQAVFEPDEIAGIEAQIAALSAAGVEDNITGFEDIIIENETDEINAQVYLQRASNPLIRVRFKSVRGSTLQFDSQPYLRGRFHVNDSLRLVKIGRRRFRIQSINDNAVIAANNAIEQLEDLIVENRLFVPVKSNWNDSSEIFGYYNMLNEQYQMTETLKFIMMAREHSNVPFFLILDEMNLSKVEHYFSDFLSCLESRYMEAGELKQEGVILHNHGTHVNSNDDYFDLVPSKIEIPRNLYVTGTVNIDETTYMFSPKVLDRANVIEFNEVNLDFYSVPNNDPSVIEFESIPVFGQAPLAGRDAFLISPERFKTTVEELLNLLRIYNLHFGYRVINEMSFFVNYGIEYIDNNEQVIDWCTDVQIYQKVLPKFGGAFGKLDEPLRKLISYLTDNQIPFNQVNVQSISTIDCSIHKYPLSLEKVIQMYKSLVFNGFTSFLE